MAYKQPHRNVTPVKQVDTSPIKLPEPSPLMQSYPVTQRAKSTPIKKTDPAKKGASYYVVGGGQGTGGQSITKGMSQDEVVVTAKKSKGSKGSGSDAKTRAEHRLEKTEKKLETSINTVGGGEKSNRLRRRAQRLKDKIARQEGKGKKKYDRKDKKFWRDNK